MVDGRTVGVWTMVACLLWLAAIGGLVAAWTTLLLGDDPWGKVWGVTACVASAGAVAATGRCYAARVCKLIRVVHGFDAQAPAGELHALR